jgi:hypothetical protein
MPDRTAQGELTIQLACRMQRNGKAKSGRCAGAKVEIRDHYSHSSFGAATRGTKETKPHRTVKRGRLYPQQERGQF